MEETTVHSQPGIPRAVVWGMALTGAVVAAALAAWSIHHLDRQSRRRVLEQSRSLRGFQSAIAGKSRAIVSRVLGPPRATSEHTGHIASGARAYWQAQVWYYPLAPREQAALAIRFEDDRASGVEIVRAPAPLVGQR